MRILWVGDSHLKKQHLADGAKYIGQLLALIENSKPEYVILSGDQFDTFDTVSSSILALWTDFFTKASKITKVIALVGNHDMAGANGGVSPMEPFKAYAKVVIVDEVSFFPDEFGPHVYFMPFIRDTKSFEETVRALPNGSILFCHQSFNGATFENGFYDPHGADVESVKHLAAVISGHVHKRQQFQNIFYPGTPFQHTFSDAGETKAVFEISLDKQGYTILEEHVLEMPRFEVIRAETISELLETLPASNALTNYKLVAKGAPSEIAQFWREEKVKAFKAGSKRVVDALTSVKPLAALSQVKGSTQKEKFHEYIKSKNWRSESDGLVRIAEEYLGT